MKSSLIRFLRHYRDPRAQPVHAEELTYERAGEIVQATGYRPQRKHGALPGWIVLHGLTTSGREHPALVRFAGAVAASGTFVFVPEIPEWTELRVAPALTVETIRAAVRALQARDDVIHERVGILGFSFGATQALVAAADPGIAALLDGIAAWGGYCDVRRQFRFAMTGEHEWQGRELYLEPDPYGAWIFGGNYLTDIPGLEDAADVAAALLELAREAGRRRIFAGDPAFDPLKRELRARIAPARRAVFDLAAPETGTKRDHAAAREIADALCDAVLRVDPLIDPTPFLPRATVPTLIAHGRDDRLVPYTESLRLADALPRELLRGCTITALFEHSGGTRHGLGPIGLAREGWRFVSVLHRILTLI